MPVLLTHPVERPHFDQPELELLLACARIPDSEGDGSAIRQMLEQRIDWRVFTGKAIGYGLASLLGRTLAQTAPDMVPDDLLDALRMNTEHTYAKNRGLVAEAGRLVEALTHGGVEAIIFQGPVLGIRAYGDLGFRVFGEPAFLVREPDITAAMTTLRDRGYEQKGGLTATQLDFIRYLRGHEIFNNRALGIEVDVYTRLVPINMMLDIDYDGLWQRARPTTLNGRVMPMLAPEDELLVLAIRGGPDTCLGLGWACDVARLIGSQPNLDWASVIERAHAQGCLRMLLLAVSLARTYFNASVPDEILAVERADPVVGAMVLRAIKQWEAGRPSESPDHDRLSMNLLRLHDGIIRQAGCAARSLFLPAPEHVSRIALPPRLTKLFVYVPIKIAQDAAMLPGLRAYRRLRAQAQHLRLGIMPVSAEQRLKLNRHNAARTAAERVLAADPNNLAAWQDLGDAFFGLGRYEAAISCYDKALRTAPESPILWGRRITAIRACGKSAGRFDIDKEKPPAPEDADGWARRAAYLAFTRRFSEAVAAADRGLEINPRHLVAMRIGIRCRISSCDWRRREDDERRVAEGLRAGVNIITPSANRAISDSEAQNLLVARLWIKPFAEPAKALWRDERYRHDRIRVAYLCSEYQDHPVGRQIVGVFEHHDRAQFDITAISLDRPNASAAGKRIEAACNRFISVHDMNDEQIAVMIRDMEIDIAIDLDRLAARARPGILARRPAALQVSYFGNAGTTGAPFFDYIIADQTLIPSQHHCHYTERIIYLPGSYQCNDSRRYVPNSTPSRLEAGLPEEGFVFCCFNDNYKISPPVFDIWMRLLHTCPGSVLWLLGNKQYAIPNLRREATSRGVAPERIVFAPFVPNDDHIARHRLADLFLDTLPCNAHATASDALWAGLPVLTCLGNSFAGRVGASLLRAVGLPELVTESLNEYEELALLLARDPQRLATIRAKLARNRNTEPLFDTARCTRDLEAAYTAIWRRQQAGLAPEPLAV